MPKCKGCGIKCERRGPIVLCGSDECYKRVAQAAYEKQRKAKERQLNRFKKKQKQKDSIRKKELRSRSEWYSLIQKEVNWYAKHVLYRGHPCYTCGKQQRESDNGGAFHAGHYRTVGGVPELRFEVRNIRIQCYQCNHHGSGMRDIYRANLLDELGEVELLWLDGAHKSLKDRFPTWQDLEAELARWRKINRKAKANLNG